MFQEYLTCDGQNFRFFHEDGRKKDIIDTEEGMNRVIYSNQTNQFVGWVHGQEDLYVSVSILAKNTCIL